MERHKLTVQILVVLIIIVVLIEGSTLFKMFTMKQGLAVQAYTYYKPEFKTPTYIDISQQDAISIVNKYMRWRYELEFMENDRYNGLAHQLENRIEINRISGWETLRVLTHEIVHLKYSTSNETYTEFKTFQLLYESNIDILVQRAKYMIFEHCVWGYYKGTEYDVSYYIEKYFTSIKNGYIIEDDGKNLHDYGVALLATNNEGTLNIKG